MPAYLKTYNIINNPAFRISGVFRIITDLDEKGNDVIIIVFLGNIMA